MKEKRLLVLVVDDEVEIAGEVCAFLTRRGFETVSVAGVSEAIEALRRERFDAVVTDMQMPDGTGVDVLRAATAERPSMVKIVMTGQAREADLADARAEGAHAICLKPFTMQNILDALST